VHVLAVFFLQFVSVGYCFLKHLGKRLYSTCFKKGDNLLTDVTKIRDLQTFAENPFVEGLGYNTRRKTEVLYDGKQAVINSDTGEVLEDHLSVARVRLVDADQFVKVYLSHLWLMFELGKPAQRVMEFMLHQVGRRAMDKGEVLLMYAEYEAYFKDRGGVSRPTYMRGLQELAQKNLIAKSPIGNVWWLNPAVVFNGDRARFITEIRSKKKVSGAAALEARGQAKLPGILGDVE